MNNNEFDNLRSSAEIFRVTESRMICWLRHVTCIEKVEMHAKYWLAKFMGRSASRWENNIRVDVRELDSEAELTQNMIQ